MKARTERTRELTFPEVPPDGPSKEKIIQSYLPLVHYVAEKVHRRLPPGVDQESLVHSGVVGLLEALERYDPGRGVAFEQYARYRIHGEVMQSLRSLDWVSRSVRAWGRKLAGAVSKLVAKLGREPSAEELAAELKISLEEYYRIDQKVSESTMLNLEDLPINSEQAYERALGEFSSSRFQDPLKSVEGKDLVEKLRAAIEELPERERLLMTLYYYEELTLREIGEILGLSEGRICQIHSQAVSRLRQALGVGRRVLEHESTGNRKRAVGAGCDRKRRKRS